MGDHSYVACTLMTMSRFRVAPRKGHLELLGNIFGYLRKYPDGAIQFNVNIPLLEDWFIPVKADWDRTVYGKAFEELPYNMPKPKGALVRQTITLDATLIIAKSLAEPQWGQCLKFKER
jgi:hypothetical protein